MYVYTMPKARMACSCQISRTQHSPPIGREEDVVHFVPYGFKLETDLPTASGATQGRAGSAG